MGTNPIGQGTANLSVNVPQAMKAALQSLADASGMKLSEYLRRVLMRVVDENTTYRVLTDSQIQTLHQSLTGVPPATTISSTSGAVLRNDYDLASLDVNFTPGPAQPIGFTAIPIHEEPATEVTRTRPKKRTK